MTAHGESLGRFIDMAHQGGAFKVNSGIRFMHCPTPPVFRGNMDPSMPKF
jgi:hypothetical protein